MNKFVLALALACCFSLPAYCQKAVILPVFPDGDFGEFVKKNIRYPEMCKENNIQGTVTVQLLIDEKGNLTRSTIVKGACLCGIAFDNEILRVINKSPQWKPAKYKEKPVKFVYIKDIVFILE